MQKEEAPSAKTIDSLQALIAAERARLRWRIETRNLNEQTPSPGKAGAGKLYEVFRACTTE